MAIERDRSHAMHASWLRLDHLDRRVRSHTSPRGTTAPGLADADAKVLAAKLAVDSNPAWHYPVHQVAMPPNRAAALSDWVTSRSSRPSDWAVRSGRRRARRSIGAKREASFPAPATRRGLSGDARSRSTIAFPVRSSRGDGRVPLEPAEVVSDYHVGSKAFEARALGHAEGVDSVKPTEVCSVDGPGAGARGSIVGVSDGLNCVTSLCRTGRCGTGCSPRE